MIAVGRNVAGSAARYLLRMIVGEVVPDRFALAALIPAALDLVRRRANAEYEVGREFAVRFSRTVGKKHWL